MKDIEFYIIIVLLIFTVWFIVNTIKYYYGEKRKIKYLHRFAKDGEKEAQVNLAKHYHTGRVVRKDSQRAAFWYQKAAFSGDESAKGYLKTFFEKHYSEKSS